MVARLFVFSLSAVLAFGQEQASQPLKSATAAAAAHEDYVLGPYDQLTVVYSDSVAETATNTVQVDGGGEVNLPLVGRLRAAGLTPRALEQQLKKHLSTYIRSPHVSVTVTEFRSQPVSVIGAVNTPGVHQLRGKRTLIEVLSAAGGLRQDAGHVIKITRRLEYGRLPLKTAVDDPTGAFSIAEVDLKSVLEADNPQENVEIRPHDVISVPRAEMVYVVGEVVRAGGFVLSERSELSVLKALSLAGGLTNTAAPANARILRSVEGAQKRTEIPVNLKKILDGKAADVAMKPEDLLFIPGSGSKKVVARAAETAVQTLSGIIIWRGGRF